MTMKTSRKLLKLLFLGLISVSFSQCASTMKLQKESPITFGEVYSKSWIAGVKGGGSGTNLFIETKTEGILLDSVYFRGKTSKLKTKPNNKFVFIGRFLSTSNTKKNLLSEDSDDIRPEVKDFPFQLEDNECVVTYMHEGKINYYKISNIIERQTDALPMSAPPIKN